MNEISSGKEVEKPAAWSFSMPTVIPGKEPDLLALGAGRSPASPARHRHAVRVPRRQPQHLDARAVVRRVPRHVQRHSGAVDAVIDDVVSAHVAVPRPLPADGGTGRRDVHGVYTTRRCNRKITLGLRESK